MTPIAFGIALETPAQLAALPSEAADAFDYLKLPSAIFDNGGLGPKRKLRRYSLILSELADRTLCRMAPEAGMRIQLDFIARFAERCRMAAENGAECVSAGFDVDRALSDPVYRKQLVELLHAFSAELAELNLPLLLPFRLPRLPGMPGIGELPALLRELPGRYFRIAAEMHPHEPGFAVLPGEVLRPIRFELSELDVWYEPETGNRLTARLLSDKIAFAGEFDRPVRVIFAPLGVEPDLLASEVAELAALVAELRQKGSSSVC